MPHFPLTNAPESRKVNGGRVSETRINPVDSALFPCGAQVSGKGLF
jgi:hypothetical protein